MRRLLKTQVWSDDNVSIVAIQCWDKIITFV